MCTLSIRVPWVPLQPFSVIPFSEKVEEMSLGLGSDRGSHCEVSFLSLTAVYVSDPLHRVQIVCLSISHYNSRIGNVKLKLLPV